VVPSFLKRKVVAAHIGMSEAQLSRKLNKQCGRTITKQDKKNLAAFYREAIGELEKRLAVLEMEG
jgi:AraC-like DNA-binding protein